MLNARIWLVKLAITLFLVSGSGMQASPFQVRFFALCTSRNGCVYFGFHISMWLRAMSARDLMPPEQRIEMKSIVGERACERERKSGKRMRKTISSNGGFSESTNTNHGWGKIRVDFIRTLTAYRIHKPFSNQKKTLPSAFGWGAERDDDANPTTWM